MAIGTMTALGLGAGALAGAGKAALGAQKEGRDRQLAAATQRYSPWTGMQAAPIQAANPIGDVLQGATGLGMVGQKLAGGGAVPPVPGAAPAADITDMQKKLKAQNDQSDSYTA